MQKLTFIGYYGFKNFGDELFVVASILAADKYWPTFKAYANSPIMEGFSAGKYRCPERFKESFAGINLRGKLVRGLTLVRTLCTSEMIVLAGGSTLSHFSDNSSLSLIEAAGRFRKIRQAGIGVSVGPFTSIDEEKACKKYLDKFSYLSLRDQNSYQIAENMNLPLQPVCARDIAGVLPHFIPKSPIREKARLGLSLCNYERYKSGDRSVEERRNVAIIKGIRKFIIEHKVPVTVFVLNSHHIFGDWEISNRLVQELKDDHNDVVVETLDRGPLYLWEKIGQCRAVFSVRLHGAISAYLQDVPFALFEYHRKCTDFLDDIKQHRLNRLDSRDCHESKVYQVLDGIYHGQRKPVMPVDEYGSRAMLNFTRAPWALQE